MRRPSGESTGPVAPSVPSSCIAAAWPPRLTNSRETPSRRATKTTCPPSLRYRHRGPVHQGQWQPLGSARSGRPSRAARRRGRGQKAQADPTMRRREPTQRQAAAADRRDAAECPRRNAGDSGGVAEQEPRLADVAQPPRRIALETSAQQLPNRRGVVAGNRDQSTSLVSTAASVSLIVSPSNSRCPVSISNTPRRTPRCPRACRPPCPAPAPAPCRPPCRGSSPPRCRARSSVGEFVKARRVRARSRTPGRAPWPGRSRAPSPCRRVAA